MSEGERTHNEAYRMKERGDRQVNRKNIQNERGRTQTMRHIERQRERDT